MPAFKCLYLLENFYLHILEIKRTDLEETAPASAMFRWLKIDKETNLVTDLSFRSMDSAGEVEERYFEEGFLKFNATIGTFIEKFNSAQHPLQRKPNSDFNEALEIAIAEHILAPAEH